MTTRRNVLVITCVAAVSLCVIYGLFASKRQSTYPVFIHQTGGGGIGEASVYKYGLKIGYVHKVELTVEDGVIAELRIDERFRLYKSDVCVIHRLHRYDDPTLYIEQSVGPPRDKEPLGDPAFLPCMIANGAWPKLPGLLEQTEN